MSDVGLLFATRSLRLFAYGFPSVVLVLYLAAIGLSEREIGLLLTLTLAGDAAVSLWITTHADRIGRRRMLLVGAALMVAAGVVFASTRAFVFGWYRDGAAESECPGERGAFAPAGST